MALKAKINTLLIMCLKNAKYRSTFGRKEGGWGGGQAVFVAKIKKYLGGWVPALKIHFFQKVPSKRG